MTPDRFAAITSRYPTLRMAVAGDFCLDRYLEIDPARAEVSLETGLPVHNVVRVRAQPGGAGTVLNNLAALGVGTLLPVGWAGDDGEGYELRRALGALPGVRLDHFLQTAERDTFTYCKPLVLEPGQPPRELSRLDRKNWTPTPASLATRVCEAVAAGVAGADAIALLSQVDRPETGVLTTPVLAAVGDLARAHPGKLFLADSRHGFGAFPPLGFKFNANEMAPLLGLPATSPAADIGAAAAQWARRNGQPVFITLAERGIVGALPDGAWEHLPAWPVRGEIDVVGAGDAVTANLLAARAAGASLREALELAAAAASLVIHQLGTTGTASVAQLGALICAPPHAASPSQS